MAEREKHHRRPKHYQGSNDKSNLILLPRSKHKTYHSLFGCGNVYSIINTLNSLVISSFEFVSVPSENYHFYKRKQPRNVSKKTNLKSLNNRKQQAFNLLFRNKNYCQIANILNEMIDPRYKIVIKER